MTEPAQSDPNKKRRRRRRRTIIALVLLVVIVALGLYFNSDSFRAVVRARVVAELERATGGKVEIDSFTWRLFHLQFEARGVTIHGLEPPGQLPYAHVDHVDVHVQIVSFLSRKVALRSVLVDHPVVHLMLYPDGTTNQPSPGGGQAGRESPERFFDLAARQVQVTNGVLVLNEARVPFELSGERLTLQLGYSPADHAYKGTVAFSAQSARYRDVPALHGDISADLILRPAETEFTSLKVSTGRSSFEGKGTLRNYKAPEINLDYTASLDASDVARAVDAPQLRAGHADLKGTLVDQKGDYSSQGTIAARGIEWREGQRHVSDVDLTSSFAVTPDKLLLPQMAVRVFGGSLRGNVQITNWSRASAQRGTAKLQLERIQLASLAPVVSSPRLPLGKINMAGGVSGNVNASWSGRIENGTAQMKLEVDPPANPAPQDVPVTAQLDGTWHGEHSTLDVAALNLATRAIRLNATGRFGSESAQAKLSVNSTDLHELRPILAALRPSTHIPVVLEGRASFNGSVSGRFNALSARGRLELENFDTELKPLELTATKAAASARTSASSYERIHWDSLLADLSYSPSSFNLQNGILRRGKASATFSAGAELHNGVLDENSSRLHFTLHLQDAPVEDAQLLLGLKYPVTGIVNADVSASGTAVNLQGAGNVQVTKMTIRGEPFRIFRSKLQFAGREVQLNDLLLAHNGAHLNGFFAHQLGGKSIRFDLTGAGIDLADFKDFQSQRLVMEGQAGFHITGSGTEDSPVINGQLDVRNIVLNHELEGSMSVNLETRGSDLLLRGRSNLENASLSVDGDVKVGGDFPGSMTLEFSHLDFDPLIRAYFQGEITGHSSMAGSIQIRGPFLRPRDLIITGNVSQLSADVENVKLQNDGPLRFSMANQLFHLEQLHLLGDNTDFSMQGTTQFAAAGPLDFHGKGRFNLKLAQGFNSNLIGYGPVTFTVDVAGNWAHPQFRGRMELSNAGLSFADLPNGLSQINGTMVFAQDRMQIEKLTARTGGGELNVGGFIAYKNGLFWDLSVTGKDVRLRWPPGASSSADAVLRYTGSAKSSLLSGDITVTRFGMNPRFDFGVYLEQTRKPLTIATLNPYLENLRLDIHIVSTPELRVETSLAKLSGDVDLHLRGTAARPGLLGRVNIAEGDVYFYGTKYRLERGDITFSNPLTIEPVLNLDMSARVQDYDITVGLHGPLTGGKALSLTYRSDPPLSNADIIALLAFGRSRDQVLSAVTAQPGQPTSDTASASSAILGEALNATVSDRVQRLFGVSRVRIDPQFIGAENNPTARVTLEQQINQNITFTYITSLTQSAETVVQVEYAVNRDISVVAVRDENGVLGFDVRIRRRKK